MSDNREDLVYSETRLPSTDDKLFAEASDWWMNACLDWSHDPSELYIVGYKDAADLLVKTVASGQGTADSLIFPIVFLYRHYIELRLKSLIEDGRRLLDHEYNHKSEHQLSKLWPPVKDILLEVFPDEDKKQYDAIDSLIEQFENVDPRSTSFRYPKDLSGNKSVNFDIPRVNLRNLFEVVRALSTILEGAATGISVYQGEKSAMNDWL